MIAGIDLSNNNPVADFAAIRAAGYEFCIHKASEGEGFRDHYLEPRWHEMKAAGVARGAYHFARPSQTSARDEADYFLGIVTPLLEPGDSVWLDQEDERFHGNASPWSLEWLDRVEQALGFTPGIYTYPSYIPERQLNDPRLGRFPLWWASYANPMRPTPRPWGKTAVWQYTSDGVVPGTTGRIDLNHFLGDSVAGFLALGKPGGIPASDDEKMETYYRNNAARLGEKKYAAQLALHYYTGKGLVCQYGVVTPDGEIIVGNVVDDWETYNAAHITPL